MAKQKNTEKTQKMAKQISGGSDNTVTEENEPKQRGRKAAPKIFKDVDANGMGTMCFEVPVSDDVKKMAEVENVASTEDAWQNLVMRVEGAEKTRLYNLYLRGEETSGRQAVKSEYDTNVTFAGQKINLLSLAPGDAATLINERMNSINILLSLAKDEKTQTAIKDKESAYFNARRILLESKAVAENDGKLAVVEAA